MKKLKNLIHYSWIQVLFYCTGSFLLFFSIINRSFASDDFEVMKRVGMDKIIWIKDFFRPLSDITLYFNYLVGGFDPKGYFLLNILMHGISSWLLFLFCMKWKWTSEINEQRRYSLIASLLFLTYPFHNESIVWGLGRASIVADLFGIAALLMVVSDLSTWKRIGITCLFYFIGMAAYESILLLPLMVFVIITNRGGDANKGVIGDGGKVLIRDYTRWAAAFAVTFLIHLTVRILVSGALMASYQNEFLSPGILSHVENVFKITGRFFLPPSDNSRRMMFLLTGLAGAWALIILSFLKKNRQNVFLKGYLLRLFLLLALASVAPVVSGISTRTSEGDRLLYLPSFFLCSGISFLLVNLARDRKAILLIVAVLISYNVWHLEKNNRNWIKASSITRDIVKVIRSQDPAKKIFVVNLPAELDGAFIFRLGLPEAMLMEGMDTSRLVIVNLLKREQILDLPDTIRIGTKGGEIQIPPVATIVRKGADSLQINASDKMNRPFHLPAGSKDIVLYWDKYRLLKLNPDLF